MKLVKAIILPVIIYGSEGWTLKRNMTKEDWKPLKCGAIEECCEQGLTKAYWMNFKQDGKLLAQIIKRKMAFLGHACKNNSCNLVKTRILGIMPWKRRRGRQGCNRGLH